MRSFFNRISMKQTAKALLLGTSLATATTSFAYYQYKLSQSQNKPIQCSSRTLPELAFDSQKIPYFNALSHDEIDKLRKMYPNLLITNSKAVQTIMSILRDRDTQCADFRKHANRVIRILLEEALAIQDLQFVKKLSPLGFYDSLEQKVPLENFAAVSILRAGNSFLQELLTLLPGSQIGQILVQRKETSREKEPIYYYSKIPSNIKGKKVLIVDPMIATGQSMKVAIDIMKSKGVVEEEITVVGIIGCKEGIGYLFKHFPSIKIVTAVIDPILLPDSKYIAPGLGDFGDRYFGTTSI